MSGVVFVELEDLDQIMDPELILPDSVGAQSIYDSFIFVQPGQFSQTVTLKPKL
jgi:hypothetical protein